MDLPESNLLTYPRLSNLVNVVFCASLSCSYSSFSCPSALTDNRNSNPILIHLFRSLCCFRCFKHGIDIPWSYSDVSFGAQYVPSPISSFRLPIAIGLREMLFCPWIYLAPLSSCEVALVVSVNNSFCRVGLLTQPGWPGTTLWLELHCWPFWLD